MARKRERLFAGFFAGLFLLTSSALTILVIYTIVTQNKSSNPSSSTQANAEKALAQQKASASQPKLTGTQLQGFTPTTQPLTQLQATDTKVGTGATVKAGATISADYEGALTSNGKIFDASADHGGPQTFTLNQVIAGWSQGIPGMKVGGTRRLLIPAAMAYGPQPPQGSGIPANADLVFDVTVTKIDK